MQLVVFLASLRQCLIKLNEKWLNVVLKKFEGGLEISVWWVSFYSPITCSTKRLSFCIWYRYLVNAKSIPTLLTECWLEYYQLITTALKISCWLITPNVNFLLIYMNKKLKAHKIDKSFYIRIHNFKILEILSISI